MRRAKVRVKMNSVREVLIRPCWMLLVEVIRGRLAEVKAFGPIFSNQAWSIVWLARVWPSTRLILGEIRCTIIGKKPSMLEN